VRISPNSHVNFLLIAHHLNWHEQKGWRATVCLWIIHEDKIKHHLKPTWITVWNLPARLSVSTCTRSRVHFLRKSCLYCQIWWTSKIKWHWDCSGWRGERWIFLEAFVFWEPNCDPGRFEMMIDATARSCHSSQWKRHPH
jgi:hypothetical protein